MLQKKMTVQEVIKAVNDTTQFTALDLKLPYLLRRAIRKNINTLVDEYKIFDAERNRILDEGGDEQEIIKMLNEEVEVSIEMISEAELIDVTVSYQDELLIEYMLEWPDAKESE